LIIYRDAAMFGVITSPPPALAIVEFGRCYKSGLRASSAKNEIDLACFTEQ